MAQTLYILGYREKDLTEQEHEKLMNHVEKWSSESIGKSRYSPFDSKDKKFSDVANTFAGETDRADNKKIIIYDDIEVENEENKKTILKACEELKSIFEDITFEVHSESERLI